MSDAGGVVAQPDRGKTNCRWRCNIFAYNFAVVAALLLTAFFYLRGHYALGTPVAPATVSNIDIAMRAMWFGAMGGIVISLKGVYDHCCAHGDWDDCFDLWHIGRPVSGALTGLITLVLLLAINPNGTPSEPVVYAVAFIFGTQERRFFNFLSEVAALVVRVPNEDQQVGLKGIDIQPAEGKPSAVVLITGLGFVKGATVTIGPNKLGNVVVAKDGRAIVGTVPPGSGEAEVTIVNPNGDRAVLANKFTYET